MLGNPALLHGLKPNGFREEGFRHVKGGYFLQFGVAKLENCASAGVGKCASNIESVYYIGTMWWYTFKELKLVTLPQLPSA